MVTGREGSTCGSVADRNEGYRRAVLSKQGLCEHSEEISDLCR